MTSYNHIYTQDGGTIEISEPLGTTNGGGGGGNDLIESDGSANGIGGATFEANDGITISGGGTITVQGATLSLAGRLGGGSKIYLDNATLNFAADASYGGVELDFIAGSQNTINLDPADLNQTYSFIINNFAAGDTISIAGETITAVAYQTAGAHSDTWGVTTESGNTYYIRVTGTDGTEQGADLQAENGSIACYLRGTLIRTDDGDKSVETLEVGDKVLTRDKGFQPIKWIGRRSYRARFIIGRKDILPICLKAHSLADATPARDLWVSPHHAMYLDDALVEAQHLLNGKTIFQTSIGDVEYYHIELASHEVILAEGAWSETFIDDSSRGVFHNARDYPRLYPSETPRTLRYCMSRLDEGPELERIRQAIEARAAFRAISSWSA